MAAPSKNFTIIPDGDIDADSPMTETLKTQERDNDIHLEEWLGKNYIAAVDHDHDGFNSKSVTGVADEAITGEKVGYAYSRTYIADYSISDQMREFDTWNEIVTGTGAVDEAHDSANPKLSVFADSVGDDAMLSISNAVRSENSWRMKAVLYTGSSISNMRLAWGFADIPTLIQTDTTPDVHGAYFLYDTTLAHTNFRALTIAGSGATIENTDTGITVAASTKYEIEIEIDSVAGEIKFYINGVEVGVNDATLPTGNEDMDMFFSMTSTSNTGADRGFYISSAQLFKNLAA